MFPPNGYEYISHLAHGQATTWIGRAINDGREVVVKTLELQRVDDWKGIELFEREVTTLQQLSHTSIPKFIRFISDEHEGAKRWHIIQEKVKGHTVETLLANTFSEEQLKRLAESVLQSLVFLQSYSPPLLHRDLKPANLILDDQHLWLIDFGSVRHVVPSRVGGSTVAGTSGYMAPEQLMGRADMSSDLYGLGMTLIHIVTKTHPDDLPKKRMKVQWESAVQMKVSDSFRGFINKLSEPHPENRFLKAEDALNGINHSAPPDSLIPKTGSTNLEIKEIDSTTVLARGLGLSFDLSQTQNIFGLAIASIVILVLLFTLNVLLILPVLLGIWYVSTKSTNTFFRFAGQTVHVEKGWLIKSKHSFSLETLLELEDKRRFKSPFEIDSEQLTGPLSFRERMHLREKLQSMAASRYDAAEIESVFDFKSNTVEERVSEAVNHEHFDGH